MPLHGLAGLADAAIAEWLRPVAQAIAHLKAMPPGALCLPAEPGGPKQIADAFEELDRVLDAKSRALRAALESPGASEILFGVCVGDLRHAKRAQKRGTNHRKRGLGVG